MTDTAYFAGGCFWGMEELLRQIPGVLDTTAGYTGGIKSLAVYEQVKTGDTGHAEAVKIIFDSSIVSYRQLLFEFFRLHNPTTSNRQGNDIGSQYRSAIFFVNDEQQQRALQVIKIIDASGDWKLPIVTEVQAYREFYPAEDYHQKYLIKNHGGYTCHYRRQLDLGE